MLRAGYRSKNAVRMFHAMQFLLGIGIPAGRDGLYVAVSRTATVERHTMQS
jgi:hypothetical protein